ncbi:IS3 family transposase [Tissierella sp. MSJ-40]|uniref:IS3 family transposase n=1 Tax=Tissierella simiarum TaxID=2841534 RepID=A0ABS6E8N7_9FIRM|nr:IS3 family transposase [Tissierella simiarum]
MLIRIRQENKYLAIEKLHEEDKYSISLLCKVAKIAHSSYYKWLRRERTDCEKENEVLIKEIINIYEKAGGIYGYRKMTMNINHKLKKNYNHKRLIN